MNRPAPKDNPEPTYVTLGDVNSVLRLPPPPMLTPENWRQEDSDLAAHLIQVDRQIQNSRWRNFKLSVVISDAEPYEHSIPPFEDFVYAAMYFRQLVVTKDNILNKCVDRYTPFIGDKLRSHWILAEQEQFNASLDDSPLLLKGYSRRDIFDAFMYGASLVHKPPHSRSPHKHRFLKLYDKEPRHIVLFALNSSMHTLLNYVSKITTVLYFDFAKWSSEHDLPRPDIRWHDRLFQIPDG